MFDLTENEKRYEKYMDSAMNILASDDERTLSVRALHEIHGGSMTTATKALQVFWRYLAKRLAYKKLYPEGTPPEVIKATEALMASARSQACNEIAEEKKQLEDLRKKMAYQVDQLKEEINALSASLESAKETESTQEEEISVLSAKLEVSRSKNVELSNTNESLMSMITQLENKLGQHETRLLEVAEERNDFKLEVETKNERLISAEGENSALAERINQLESTAATSAELLAEVKSSNDQLVSKATLLNQSLSDERNKVSQAELINSNNNKLISDFETEVKTCHDHEKELKSQVAMAQKELMDARMDARIMEERILNVEALLSETRKEKDRLISLLEKAASEPPKPKSEKSIKD